MTEEDLILSNKLGFGDEIGSVTNRITAMIDVASSFDKDSEEHKELQYRIVCGQNYQQNSIDKMKGILCKPMPKEWYDYHSAKETENKDFNLRILADKKPYFFIYNYQGLYNEYKKYIENSNRNCLMRFGLDVGELIQKENKTEEQEKFLKYYYKKMPVFLNHSTMNRICWKLEEEFNYIKEKCDNVDFDYQVLKTDKEYSNSLYNQIKELYNQYKVRTSEYQKISKKNKIDREDRKIARNTFVNDFKQQTYEICNNSEDLCNMLIDLCYNNNSSKQFVWDVCGDVIIDNLLKKNDYIVQYPILDENGSIEYGGKLFSLHTTNLKEMEEYDIEVDFE